MITVKLSSLLIVLGSIGWSLVPGGIILAQTTPSLSGELPPPPAMTQFNDEFSSQGEPIDTIPYFESTPTTPESKEQEYNFQAPQQNYYSVPGSYPSVDKLVEFYRVEVITQATEEEKSLLSQVKQIEPFAYTQMNDGVKVIYAGLFQDQQEAQQRIQQLTNQGFSARIVPVSYSVSSSYDIPVQR